MCGRYYTELSPELRPFIEAAGQSAMAEMIEKKLGKTMKTEGEIFPGDSATVIALNKNGEKKSFAMVWGFSMNNSKQLIINARSESAKEKKMFYDAWYRHRCIVPASAYIEWRRFRQDNGKMKTGERYRIAPENSITWLCGLYRMEEGIPHFVILTKEPSDSVSFIHDRMPMILSREDADLWIDPKQDPDQLKEKALTQMKYVQE